ncbi:TPA: redoxin domain-containing protein [Bacillus toyonensis]|nr:redoxin domain-containing protein [Bacillus toyonensis]
MEQIYIVSNVLLWIILLIQLAFMIILTKLIINFLNRFGVESSINLKKRTLNVGENSPYFKGKNQNGELVSLSKLLHSRTLLIFANPDCPSCYDIINNISNLREANLNVIVISYEKFNNNTIEQLPWVHFIEDNTIAQDYLITESPYMVLINEKRNIQFLGGKEKINLLITEILTANAQSSAVL